MQHGAVADERILANLIAARARTHGDLDVLTCVEVAPDGRFLEEVRSYRMLWHNGQALAAALRGAGMQAGQSFALLLQNHPEFVEAMVASSILGTVFVPIDPRTRGDKLAFMLRFAECRGAIVADYTLEHLLPVLPQLPQLRWLWVLDGGAGLPLPQAAINVSGLREHYAPPAAELPVGVEDPEAVMQMLFTSGTTGDPKAILASYARFSNVASIGPLIGWTDVDRPYTGLSLTHANAQLITLGNSLKMGLRLVISRRFTKSRLWDICRHYGCTVFNLLGGMTTAVYSEPRRAEDADNPVRMVLSAGMPAAIWEDFAQRFGVRIFEFYGAAEGGMTFNPPGVGPIGSIGKPPPTLEARVVDEAGNECPPGVRGEIVFRNTDGSPLRVEYYRNPEASAKKTAGGWLRMGDVGHRDAGGWFYFDYRIGGGIRHNGDFVNVAFVEKAIAEHPQVDDVFVYGVEAASGVPGEKDVVAAVVPRRGAGLDVEDLFRHCRRVLEPNFVPSYLQLMQEIPKTASEKPQERFCLEHFRAHPEAVHTERAAQQPIRRQS
jgi:crotonobetaine/carnitine-CoA ligase